MKLVLLMVFFSTPDKPEIHAGHPYGFGHIEVRSMDVCVKRRDLLLRQLERGIKDPKIKYTAFCTEMTLMGFSEGYERFKRTVGDLL